jgi:chromate reductase, NAD(P)H dehydrogenase (quinone)
MAYKIAIIVGSLREASLNRKLARSICAMRNDNLECSMIEIGDLPLYNQDSDANPPEQYVRFRQQIAEADGVLFVSPEYNRGIPGVLKNAIDVGSRPYGQSAFDKKPAAIVTASPGSIGGFGANHQIRQAAVFLNMPVMQQPEAYLGHVSDDSFDADGCLKEGPLKELVASLAHAFHDWVDMIHRSRQLLAEDAAHAQAEKKAEPALTNTCFPGGEKKGRLARAPPNLARSVPDYASCARTGF